MCHKEIITILCATDNSYAPYCGIMLTSLFESNRDCCFSVYLMTDDSISERNRRKFEKLEVKYGNSIALRTVNVSMFANFPLNADLHITLPTYFRLLAPDIIPQNVKRCIYLDCDVIVCGSVKDLWNVVLSGKAIAGVMDCESNVACNRLGYPSDIGYINAGISVFNLDYWRENHIQEKAFRYARDQWDRLVWMDQDIINGLLHDSMLLLPFRFNIQNRFFVRSRWIHYTESFRNTLKEELKKAVIIHYSGGSKPWSFRYTGGFQHASWEKIRKMSFWRNCRIKRPITKYIKRLIKQYCLRSLYRDQINNHWILVPETEHL